MVYIDNDTKLKVKVKLPILKYNVICGEYKNLKNAIAFSNQLKANGVESKIMLREKSKATFLVCIYETNNYQTAKTVIKERFEKLKEINPKLRLWVLNKNMVMYK